MNLSWVTAFMRLNLIIINLALPALSGLAEDVPSKLEQAATFAPAESRWSVTAGAEVRSLGADFRMARPAPLNTTVFGGLSNRDPGLYRGGSGTVHYADGQVGPDYNSAFAPSAGAGGDALGIIDNAGQVKPNVRTETTFGTPIAELRFHSYQVTGGDAARGTMHPYGASDSDTGLGGSLSFAFTFKSTEKDSLAAVLGWSCVQSNPGSGQPLVSAQGVTRHQSQINHTYIYDYDQGSGTAANPGAGFPFDASSSAGTAGYIVYNPVLYSGQPTGDGFLGPREISQGGSSTVKATAVTQVTGLRVTLNEINLAVRWERLLRPWLHAGISVGPTLNIVNSDFSTQTAWYLSGSHTPAAVDRWRQDHSQVKAGFMGQLTAQADISPRLFVEFHAGYRWVADADVDSGPASARLNLSSWAGGIGVGIRF